MKCMYYHTLLSTSEFEETIFNGLSFTLYSGYNKDSQKKKHKQWEYNVWSWNSDNYAYHFGTASSLKVA